MILRKVGIQALVLKAAKVNLQPLILVKTRLKRQIILPKILIPLINPDIEIQ
jgi:hypothetical protein